MAPSSLVWSVFIHRKWILVPAVAVTRPNIGHAAVGGCPEPLPCTAVSAPCQRVPCTCLVLHDQTLSMLPVPEQSHVPPGCLATAKGENRCWRYQITGPESIKLRWRCCHLSWLHEGHEPHGQWWETLTCSSIEHFPQSEAPIEPPRVNGGMWRLLHLVTTLLLSPGESHRIVFVRTHQWCRSGRVAASGPRDGVSWPEVMPSRAPCTRDSHSTRA